MGDETTTIETFIEDAELLVMDRRQLDALEGGRFKNHPRWWVTIAKRGDELTLTTPFHTGVGDSSPPELADVLDCFASDCAGYDQASGNRFEWAADYDLDPFDPETIETFRSVEVQREKVLRLLGPELYDRLLFHTERL